MPLFEYAAVYEDKCCEHCSQGFEVIAKLDDPDIFECPQCHNPVRKKVSLFTSHTASKSMKDKLSDKNLEKQGFTKLVKNKKGSYDVIGAGREELGKKITVNPENL